MVFSTLAPSPRRDIPTAHPHLLRDKRSSNETHRLERISQQRPALREHRSFAPSGSCMRNLYLPHPRCRFSMTLFRSLNAVGWERDERGQSSVQDHPVEARVKTEGLYHPRLSIENPYTSLSLTGVRIDERKSVRGMRKLRSRGLFCRQRKAGLRIFTQGGKEAGLRRERKNDTLG